MDEPPLVKEGPNYELSGLLGKAANQYKGVTLKYAEPAEARVPPANERWRLYVFKGDEQIDVVHICKQSAYLCGRERAVVDIAIEHPSCSKQHAVVQFRQVVLKNSGSKTVIKPYIIDLDSANGTQLNGHRIDARRYYEILPKDVIKFAQSSREYVFIREDL